MRSALRLVVCLVLCYGIAAVGALTTASSVATWYATLAKPAWTPPNIVFPIAWNILYALMALSLWLLWDRSEAGALRTRAITLFLVQLALNAIWSPVFFGARAIWSGLAVLLLLIVVVILTIRAAWPVHRTAAALLLPYLLWISYASTLNAGIGIMNRG